MNAIIAIDIILILLAILLFLWTWTKKPKSKKTEVQSNNSSSKTQKISAIGKTIFGALGKIVSWVLILGLIAGATLIVYCFLFPSTDTIYFTPNTRENQKVFDLEEPGTYEIKVSGSYKKCFLRDGKEELWRMPPNGMTRTNWPSAEYCRHLPLPNYRPFMVIAIIDGKVIPVGYGRKIKVNKPTAIYLNINVPQNWAEVPGKNPEDNFKHNRESMRVTIEKDWAILEKIAEIFNSLGQYFKG